MHRHTPRPPSLFRRSPLQWVVGPRRPQHAALSRVACSPAGWTGGAPAPQWWPQCWQQRGREPRCRVQSGQVCASIGWRHRAGRVSGGGGIGGMAAEAVLRCTGCHAQTEPASHLTPHIRSPPVGPIKEQHAESREWRRAGPHLPPAANSSLTCVKLASLVPSTS